MIETFLASYAAKAIGGAIAVPVLGWILAKIPTGKWTKQLSKVGESNGKDVTAFCQKKIPLYNKVIEPVFIDTLAVIPAYISGFIVGLKSDN